MDPPELQETESEDEAGLTTEAESEAPGNTLGV